MKLLERISKLKIFYATIDQIIRGRICDFSFEKISKKLNDLSSNVLVFIVLHHILRLDHILQMFNTYRKYKYLKEAVK